MSIREVIRKIYEVLPSAIEPEINSEIAPPWIQDNRNKVVRIDVNGRKYDDYANDAEPNLTIDLGPESRDWAPIDEEQKKYGIEALAWYWPYHLKPAEKWGIYLREQGISRIIDYLLNQGTPKQLCWAQAYQLLFRHEFFHFLTEFVATFQEINLHAPLYVRHIKNKKRLTSMSLKLPTTKYHSLSHLTVKEFEEALANANVLMSKMPKQPVKNFMRTQPTGYKDFAEFLAPTSFIEGKRILCESINNGAFPENFWEILFNVPKNCSKEIPVFLVKDNMSKNGIIQFAVKTHGAEILMFPNDHPPPHIHVRIPSDAPERKYTYPNLAPFGDFPELSNAEKKKINLVMETVKFKKGSQKIPWLLET